MKIEKKKDRYQVTMTHDELLMLVNGLAGRQLLIRDITSLLSPGSKKQEKELAKLHQALAEALPLETWKNGKKVSRVNRRGEQFKPAKQKAAHS